MEHPTSTVTRSGGFSFPCVCLRISDQILDRFLIFVVGTVLRHLVLGGDGAGGGAFGLPADPAQVEKSPGVLEIVDQRLFPVVRRPRNRRLQKKNKRDHTARRRPSPAGCRLSDGDKLPSLS